ncbi:MAG: hypothetical protein ACOX19_02900 [Fermentimonas sp.]
MQVHGLTSKRNGKNSPARYYRPCSPLNEEGKGTCHECEGFTDTPFPLNIPNRTVENKF